MGRLFNLWKSSIFSKMGQSIRDNGLVISAMAKVEWSGAILHPIQETGS